MVLNKGCDILLRRKTNQEGIVYDAIEALGHVTSEQLIQFIKNNDSEISLASIYRNVKKLFDEKRIRKVKVGEIEVYETVKAKHYHYICRCCGHITDIQRTELPFNLAKMRSINGDDINDCDLVLYGICHTCKNKNSTKGEKRNEEVCM